MKNPRLCVLLCVLAVLSTSLGWASDPSDVAKEHFERGVARANDGDLPAALEAFQSAYAAQPHFSVLYNIGLAYSRLGRGAEAARAFESYLQQGGALIPSTRREEVEKRIEEARARLGTVNIVSSRDAEAWLDGVRISVRPPAHSLELSPGQHSLLHWQPRGVQELRFEVKPGQATTLELPLPAEERVGWLEIRCPLLDSTITLSSGQRLESPLGAPVPVPEGPVDLSFSRSGYVSFTRRLQVLAGVTTPIKLEPAVDPKLSPKLAGTLSVDVPPDARVYFDGGALLTGLVPAGRHVLRAERKGFVANEQVVVVEAGRTLHWRPSWRATPAALAARRERARARRTGWAMAAGSLAFLAGGTGLYLWNTNRYSKWREDSSGLSLGANLDRATSLQRADDLAVGLIAIGAGLSIAATWTIWGATP